MKRFGYALDPLCLLACGLYALNRAWLRQHVGGEFLTGYFNDVLLIPAALPLVLWVQRRLGVRDHDGRPRWHEILLHLAVWSFVAEAIVPGFVRSATRDWFDLIAYAAGATGAGVWWKSAA